MKLSEIVKNSRFGRAYHLAKQDAEESLPEVYELFSQSTGYRFLDLYQKYILKEIIIPSAEPIAFAFAYLYYLVKNEN